MVFGIKDAIIAAGKVEDYSVADEAGAQGSEEHADQRTQIGETDDG